MKKIFNILVLLVFCLLPIFGNAKTSAVYEWKLDDNAIISKKAGDYYFISYKDLTMNVYSKEGEKLSSSDFSGLLCGYSFDEIMNDEVLSKMYSYQKSPLLYNSELNEYYDVDYIDKTYRIFDKRYDIDFFDTYNFDDDLEYTKKLLGFEYTLYENALNSGFNVNLIYKENDRYIVYGSNSNGASAVRVYDSNMKVILEKTDDYDLRFTYKIDGDKIYFVNEIMQLEVYDLNGNLLDKVSLADEIIDELNQYSGFEFRFFNFDIIENNIVVSYALYSMNPASDNPRGYVDIFDTTKDAYPDLVSFKFRLTYDVEVPTENGKVNLENKVDENDREYVELEIVPDPGFSIGKVTVTDANGSEIEVTDSKFYMPSSDVKIDVEFIKGEYLPIPDTFLGKSVSLILIGLILISLGIYTVNYIRQE